MKILIVNAGSSSMKFQVYSQVGPSKFDVLAKGLYERIGLPAPALGRVVASYGNKKITTELALPSHSEAATHLINFLTAQKIINNIAEIKGIGHRVVNGGENFLASTLITDQVIAELESIFELAPLHNPPAVKAMRAFKKYAPVPAVAVFDTTFHTTMPPANYLYPLPIQWYRDYKVRRYGAHGTSYRYIVQRLAKILNKPVEKVNTIVCHLGNGSSVCAIKNGKSVATSMGLTPLEGLMMGTRSGDIDPAIVEFMSLKLNIDAAAVVKLLNKKSGLLGISQISPDAREIEIAASEGNKDAALAITMYTNRVSKYISIYQNEFDEPLDAIVFTAGIGENSAIFRTRVCQKLKTLQLKLNETVNQDRKYDDYLLISSENSAVPVFKIRTNEEIIMCNDVDKILTVTSA